MADDNERNMAEAVVDQSRNRFYCHQCSVEINPTLPQYTCPRCQNGFIEEITENFQGHDNGPAAVNGPGQRIDFAELWSQQLLDSFRQASEPPRQDQDRTGGGGGSSHNQSNSAPHPERDPADSDDDDLWSVQPPPDIDSLDDDGDASDLFPNFLFPRAHIQFRTSRGGGGRGGGGAGRGGAGPGAMPLQNLIGQLLSGLSGGGAAGGGMPPFIFGNLMGPGLHGNPGDYAWGPGGLDAIISQLMNQLEGSGPPAASKEQMDKLPSTQITKEQLDNGAQCSVCMEDFKLEETVRQLPCQHCYHTDCIIPWLKIHGTCPVCRKTLDGQDTSCQEESLMDAVNSAQTPTPSTDSSTGPSTSSSNPPPPRDFESEYD